LHGFRNGGPGPWLCTSASQLIELADYRLDLVQTVRLDRAVRQLPAQARTVLPSNRPVRLAAARQR